MKKPFIWILPALLFAACERPIDIDLDAGQAQYTIDAFVNTLDSEQVIRITRSIPFTADPSTIPGVTGAQVAIIDSTNFKVFFFQDKGNGVYSWKPNRAAGDTFAIGHQFVLAVAVGSDTFISGTLLRPTATIDSIGLVNEPESLGVKGGKYVELWARPWQLLPHQNLCQWQAEGWRWRSEYCLRRRVRSQRRFRWHSIHCTYSLRATERFPEPLPAGRQGAGGSALDQSGNVVFLHGSAHPTAESRVVRYDTGQRQKQFVQYQPQL